MIEDIPKSRRGGRRAGAGRKKKDHAAGSTVAGLDLTSALAAPPPAEIETIAQRHARSVLDGFVRQLLHGTSEPAKIAAAISILDRVFGKPTSDAGGAPMLPFFGTAPANAVATEIREAARAFAHLAIEVLAKIASNGASETARVSAGRALWDRGLGTAALARVPDDFAGFPIGKKQEAARAAKTAGDGTAWGDDLRPPPTAGQRRIN
jgi:hypothetical protein